MNWYDDPVYRLMCEKALEIREKHEFEIGDYCYNNSFRDAGVHIIGNDGFQKIKGDFCLFRQDQLQEKVGIHLDLLIKKFKMFYLNLEAQRMNISVYTAFASMEQLWMAFLYKKKYNKQWSGTDWEEIND